MKRSVTFFTCFFLSIHLLAQNDILVHTNGDKLIGEVKKMRTSVLVFKTDYSDSDFQIEWDKVKEFYSDRIFLISLSNGNRYNGTINTDSTDISRALIKESRNVIATTLIDIVMIEPLEKTFLGRLSASIDFGYNLTKANSLKQAQVRSLLGYTTQRWIGSATFDLLASAQEGIEDTRRDDATVQAVRLLNRGWFVAISGNFLKNTEQKLKLRSTTQAAAGKYLINNYRLYLIAFGGMAWNNEKFTDPEQEQRNSAEGYIGSELDLFNTNDLKMVTNLSAYPGISEPGRFRANFKFDIKYDLPLDFYIRVGYTHNFDNRPIEGASKHDYVLQTSFGWEL